MAVMLIAPGVAHAACANEDAPFSSISATAAADAVACIANEERAAAGKSTLTRNSRLQGIAESQANYISSSGNFSHIDDEGDSPSDRATDAGYNWKAVGENLVIATTPREAVDRWLDDPPHRKILLRSKYREFGSSAAAYDSDGLAVYCMTYGRRR